MRFSLALSLLLPFLPFAIMAFGFSGLVEVEALLAKMNAHVPDKLPANGFPVSYAAAFASLTGPAADAYLGALWKYDLLFPLGYGALFFLLSEHAGPWRFVALAAMAFDLLENVVAWAILTQDASLMPLYALLNMLKFACFGAAVYTLLVSFVLGLTGRGARVARG